MYNFIAELILHQLILGLIAKSTVFFSNQIHIPILCKQVWVRKREKAEKKNKETDINIVGFVQRLTYSDFSFKLTVLINEY